LVAADGLTARGMGVSAGLAGLALRVAAGRWGETLAVGSVASGRSAAGRVRRALARCGRFEGSWDSTSAWETRLRGAGIVL
jgi:hypothetical protein